MKTENIDFDIRDIMVELQRLGVCLKNAVFGLPESDIKRYFLLEIVKPFEFKRVADFYSLRNKIANIIDIIVQEEIGEYGEVLELLEEIREKFKEVDKYIEIEVGINNGNLSS